MNIRVKPAFAAVALVGLAAGTVSVVRAGCLAPSDAIVDGAGAVGVFWGNTEGELLYVRDVTGTTPQLVRRSPAQGALIVAEAGTRNNFLIGSSFETWEAFHAGTLSSDGDLAFVASTTIDDDEQTSQNEAIPRRGVYAQRGNTLYEVGRFGSDSPVRGGLGDPVPWGSFFDAAAERRTGPGFASIVFSGQIGAPDGRVGIFRWSEETFDITPLVLVGDPSPAGGTITTLARMRANEQGDIAFFALSAVGQEQPTPGLFLALDDGSRLRLVRFGLDGDVSPAGGKFSILNDFGVADDSTVVFSATLAGAPAKSGLFRASPPTFSPEVVALEGDPTGLGGSYGTFEPAKVRVTPGGDIVFGVRLSDDVGGEGVFTLPAGSDTVVPLANPDSSLAVAILGDGAAAYQTQTETHTVVPSDGNDEGPTDFRVAKLDLKNKVPLKADSIRFGGAFRLPAVGEGPGESPPVVFGNGDYTVFTGDRSWSGEDLVRIEQVQVQVSRSPGNTFVFALDGRGGSTLEFNEVPSGSPKVKLASDGSSARFSYRANVGRGKLTVDLADGTFDFRLAQGTINPSFEPAAFQIGFTLLSESDVAAGRSGDEAFFHYDFTIAAEERPFGRGRRIVSAGETVPGGTLFVDSLSVKRKLKVAKGQADPDVDSDTVKLNGTLRLCPGGTPPSTPGLRADVRIGDLVLDGLPMARRGKGGSRYRYKSGKGATPKVTLDVDVVKGTFKLKAKGAPPLSQLTDADFSGTSASNDSRQDVGGMVVPFELSVERVYEAAFDVPMTRKKGGKAFQN